MIQQNKWLKELLEKKPKNYEEYFYPEIQHYFGITFENEKNDIKEIFRLCGDYAKELSICKNKKEVKIWLDDLAIYIANNIETDYLIENYLTGKQIIEDDVNSDSFKTD